MARLLATGSFRPPLYTNPIPRPKGELRTDNEAGELLEQMREEERY